MDQIRSMVLHAAETIIREEGFQALTVRKIALDIGYTVGTIYMVFTNMNDLAQHIKGRTLDQLSNQLQQRLVTEASDEQKIHDLAMTYWQFAEQNQNCWRMIFEWPGDSVPAPDWYQEKVEQMFFYVETLFRNLMPGKPVDQARLAARTLWSSVHGVSILAMTGYPQGIDADQAQQQLMLLVRHFVFGWRSS
jgi:AcrR family transcriptional regulator